MTGSAACYARSLLEELGLPEVTPPADLPQDTPAQAWARSGALWLTGREDGPPVLPRAPLASAADGTLAALRALAPCGVLREIDGARLLGEHAATADLRRRGRTSPGGSCRLLRARDGWLAVNLPRGEEDWRMLPAWLESPVRDGEPWPWLADRLASRPVEGLLERARWLGLAVAPADAPSAPGAPWLRIGAEGPQALPRRDPPCIADLSSLWAGPLCTHLLSRLGARVVKVESTRRPDGARRGPGDFFDLLNAGKESVALDLSSSSGRDALRRILGRVDVVVESARPRALRQMGIVAEEWVAAGRGRIWLGLTGYGRGEPEGSWIAFGDDAAAAAGLAFCVPREEAPLIVGDAIADPLSGLHAALAVWACWRQGGGRLLDVSLCGVVSRGIAAGSAGPCDPAGVAVKAQAPRARRPPGRGPSLGEHGARWK